MDNLTHSLVGVCLSRAGLNRLAPDALPILLLAANAPDIDMVAAIGGAATLLHWHRNWTHSLFFSLLLAATAVVLVRLFSKVRTGWLTAIAAAWIGVLSHLLLDLTNNYGVRLWEPFSGRWVSWDSTFVVDPYLWAALLAALALPLLGRLLSSEIGARKRAYPPRGWAVFALAFVTLFDGARAVLHARATAILDSRIYNGEVPRRVAAFATPLNPLIWQGMTELSDRYYLYTLDLGGAFHPDLGRVQYKNDPGDAVAALRNRKEFGALIEFAQYPLWRVIADGSQPEYRVTDLRFGDPVRQTFTCSARVSRQNQVSGEHCDFNFASNFTP